MTGRVKPGVTAGIALATALISLGLSLAGAEQQAAVLMGFIPARLAGDFILSPAVPVLLTPLTATLVHGGLLHLAFNLLMLLFCGLAVERVLGGPAVVVLYIVGAYVAAAGQFLAGPHLPMPMIGASGAISALVGAYALSFGTARVLTGSRRLDRLIHIAWLAAAWAAIQLMVGFVAGAGGILVAVAAHIAGFLAGLALHRPLLLWRYRGA